MPEIAGLAIPEILGAITGGGAAAAGLGGLAAAAPEAAAVAAPAAAGAIDVGLPALAAEAAPLAEGAAALPATAAGLDAGVAGLGAAAGLDAAGAFSALGGAGTAGAPAAAAPSALAPAAPSAVTPLSSAPLGGGATSAAATAAPASVGPAASAFPADVTQVAGAGGAAAPAATPASPLAGFGSSIVKNPLSLVGAGGVLFNALRGDQKPKFEPQLNAIGTNAAVQSGQLESYLSTGTLPPGVQTALTSAGESAKASIRSQYANRGMTGSSAEAQDLQNVDNTLVSQGATIAQNLYNSGVQQAQLADQVYAQLMQSTLQQDQGMSSAFGNLAGAAALVGTRAA